jgi:hypothetical protein
MLYLPTTQQNQKKRKEEEKHKRNGKITPEQGNGDITETVSGDKSKSMD